MSKKVVNTGLSGHSGPIQTSPVAEAIERLREVLETKGFTGENLVGICAHIRGYVETIRPITEDKYTWFWAVRFTVPRGTVLIAIPWAQDFNRADGSGFDRAINVYVVGGCSDAAIVAAVDAFAQKSALLPPRERNRE